MNPANYKGFIDPNGGEWIELTGTKWKGVVWRPTNLDMVDDKLSYNVEMFEGPGVPEVTNEDWESFGRACGNILTDILAQEVKDLEQIKEITENQESPDEPPKIIV